MRQGHGGQCEGVEAGVWRRQGWGGGRGVEEAHRDRQDISS